jgi:prophage regulatory protein
MKERSSQSSNDEKHINKIIKLREVSAVTGLSRSSIYRRISENSFPRSVSLGGQAVGWVEAEVQQWILERVSQRDAGQ